MGKIQSGFRRMAAAWGPFWLGLALGWGLAGQPASLLAAPQGGGLRGPASPLSTHHPIAFRPAPLLFPQPENSSGSPLEALVSLYQHTLSPLDGDRCHMAPTCSLYGRQALKRYGPLLGLVITTGRLLHEGDELHNAPTIHHLDGIDYYADPLELNTYWWQAE